MATYLELKQQAEKLLAQAEEMREAERAEVIADIKQKIAAYELGASDLGFSGGGGGAAPRRAASGTRKSPAAKFKGPNGELWSGRGRQPKWMVSALAAGKKVDEFRI